MMPLGTALPETEKTLKAVEKIVKRKLPKDGKDAYKPILPIAGAQVPGRSVSICSGVTSKSWRFRR
jgi:hypothetical protein